MAKEVPERHKLGGLAYLLLSFVFIGIAYNTAYPFLAGYMYLFFLWIFCYHAFVHYLTKALIKFFPELLSND
jgi:hypothetical protein